MKTITIHKEDYTCGVCQEMCVYPHLTIPCMHRFCERCIKGHTNKKCLQGCNTHVTSTILDRETSDLLRTHFAEEECICFVCEKFHSYANIFVCIKEQEKREKEEKAQKEKAQKDRLKELNAAALIGAEARMKTAWEKARLINPSVQNYDEVIELVDEEFRQQLLHDMFHCCTSHSSDRPTSPLYMPSPSKISIGEKIYEYNYTTYCWESKEMVTWRIYTGK